MTKGNRDNPNISIGGFAVKGHGSRSNVRRVGDMVTSALAGLTAGQDRHGLADQGDSLGDIKVQVPHDADARQIELALRAAIRRKGGDR